MSHSPHESLPGYSPAQIVVDGCRECESRSIGTVLAKLDPPAFARAWQRAVSWQREGIPDVSQAETGLLFALWSVAWQLDKRGVPIGAVPEGAFVVLSPAETGAGS